MTGYGAFDYVATKKEAEEMRAHKSIWEQGTGKKEWIRDADLVEIAAWNNNGPYSPDRDEDGA